MSTGRGWICPGHPALDPSAARKDVDGRDDPGHDRNRNPSLRGRRDHAIAAVVLGAVEREVGALEDIRHRLTLALQRREAD